LLVAGVLLIACGRTGRRDGVVNASAGASSQGGSATGGSAGVAGEPQCPAAAAPEAPLRLLSSDELAVDLRDAFGIPVEVKVAPSEWPPRVAEPPTVDEDFIYEQAHLARELASTLSEPSVLARLSGCDVAVQGEGACRAALRDFVLARLFRGLADASSGAELETVFDSGVKLGGGFQSGARAMLEVALQSPEYLYHVEWGTPAVDRPAGWGKLTGIELASRLSFLLWGSGPDAALLTLARDGALATSTGLEEQARRMLRDARARLPVRRFYRRLLGITGKTPLAPQRFPDFTAAVAESLPVAFDRFVDDVTWEAGGDFRTLLRSPRSWFNDDLGRYYGVAIAKGTELRPVEQDPRFYSGIVTQAAVLAAPTFGTYPILRGAKLVRAFSCLAMPPHPQAFGDADPEPLLWGRPLVEQTISEGACGGCHRYIDQVGFGLEYFDASGRFRESVEGAPVNARGVLWSGDSSRSFEGAPELAELILESPEARACFVRSWQSFAYGTPILEPEPCAEQQLIERFEGSQGNIQELIVALTQTDQFNYRAIPEDQP
jgi:hypothetical protein